MVLRRIAFIVGCLYCLSVSASKNDSIQVERWLCEARALPKDSCRTLHFAKKMLGVPYVAGTLDVNDEESLIVHLDKVDCTTLVETVLALAVTDREGRCDYASFKKVLTRIRYRDGVMAGYSSRLHYFSDWIRNNEEKGIVCESTSESACSRKMSLWLDFMSTHAESYLPMKKAPSLVAEIALCEKAWQGTVVSYIPKDQLYLSSHDLRIKDGDILAITTNIKGLDVVHVGFAFWREGRLHLLHASSVANKVIEDPQSLFDYCKNKKSQTGIRVIRLR